MYKTYEALKRGENFEANARNWMDANLPNPFDEGTEAHKLYFKAHQYCVRWRRGGIDCRSGKKYMFNTIHKLIDIGTPNPYSPADVLKKKETLVETKEIQTETKEQPKMILEEKPEINEEEIQEDAKYLLYCMANAYNEKNEASYEMYVAHLLDMNVENPFKLGSDEYELFSIMQTCWTKTPPNKRKSYVVGKQLCELINNTEVEPEKPKETVLGVVPEEKKSWFKFLFPWKKEGESDDSTGID